MNSALRVLRRTHNSQFNVRPRLCQRGFQTKQRFHESQVFPYAREQVFDLVADVDRYHEFVPMCTDSRVFRSTANTEQAVSEEPALASPAMIERQSFQAELAVGYPPFRERYMSNVVLERPWRIVATAVPDGGIFTHMRTVWEFAEAISNSSTGLPANPFVRKCMSSTRVSFSIEYEFASALHAQAASLVFDKMAQSNLVAYLARCQQLYGK